MGFDFPVDQFRTGLLCPFPALRDACLDPPDPRALVGATEEASPEVIGKALEVVCEYLDEARASKLRAEYMRELGAGVKTVQKRTREAPKRDAWKMTEDADNNQALAMGFGKESKVRPASPALRLLLECLPLAAFLVLGSRA